MIHLPHATAQIARMVRTIRFPLLTLGTPLRTPVDLADENVLAVEGFQPRTVRVGVGGHVGALFVISAAFVSSFSQLLGSFALGLLAGGKGHEARVQLGCKECS